MVMDTQVRDGMPLTVRVDCAGRRIPDKPGFVEIVFYCGIAAQRSVILRNRRLVHQEIRAHAVNSNRVLRHKNAGDIVIIDGGAVDVGLDCNLLSRRISAALDIFTSNIP